MQHSFDAGAIRQQIDHLLDDRQRIDRAIRALEDALRDLENIGQGELFSENAGSTPGEQITLQQAVKAACMEMKDGITRQRVLSAIGKRYPLLKPNPSSVSAALINFSRGDKQILHQALEGKGRKASVYSTEGDVGIQLSAAEQAALMDEKNTTGTGGWQLLFQSLQTSFEKSSGLLTMSPESRARVLHYYHAYGQGGWQNKVRKIFGRHFPHFFID